MGFQNNFLSLLRYSLGVNGLYKLWFECELLLSCGITATISIEILFPKSAVHHETTPPKLFKHDLWLFQ